MIVVAKDMIVQITFELLGEILLIAVSIQHPLKFLSLDLYLIRNTDELSSVVQGCPQSNRTCRNMFPALDHALLKIHY